MHRRLLVSLLVLGGLFAARIVSAQDETKSSEGAKPTPKTVAVFRLSGTLSEAPLGEDLPFGGDLGVSLRQVVERFNKAADDPQVAAVVLLCDGLNLGTAQLGELRQAMDRVRSAGKQIHAHADSLTMDTYVLLSGVNRLAVNPTGDVLITGLYSESPYLRGLLDKLGIVPDFFTCGEYKSAAEMFMRHEPSPEAEQNRTALLDSIFATYVERIATGRGTTAEQVRQWIDQGVYSAARAQQAGIIDAVEDFEQFESQIKTQMGSDVRFDKRYGKKQPLEIDLSSPFGLFKFYADLLAGPKRTASGRDAIAIVYVEGPIMAGSPAASPFSFANSAIAYSSTLREALDKAARDDSIKAVVLRVNSPGGSAVASEIILAATKRVKANKPLVVSMGDVAGSGGYYVACGADTIFADATTVTGSIGVVSGKLATAGLWEKLGVHWQPQQRGENAGLLGSGKVFSERERAQMQQLMDDIYEAFQGHVLAIRKDRLKKPLDELAGGRVFTGQQALEVGLVDRLGSLQDAIAHVAEQAGLKEYEIRTLPKPVNFLDALLGLDAKDSDTGRLEVADASLNWQGLNFVAPEVLAQLDQVDPIRSHALKQALTQLSILHRERLALTMEPLWFAAP